MTNIILCGGSGTRLWPLSRESYPKQFCCLTGKYSLFQETLLRNKGLFKKTIIVTNAKQFSLAKSQAEKINISNVEYVLEPIGRNTAPAITIACLGLNDDDIVFVTPSDHHIREKEKYRNTIKNAKMIAKTDYLVTFGIKPASPETKYGYIEAKGESVISFKEKPNEKYARKYVKSGNYYWNSGMFMFKAKTYLGELKRYSNGIFSASQEAFKHREVNNGCIKIKKSYMDRIPANSIDYAVMEKSKKIKMIHPDIDWSDLGSFEAIYEISKPDELGNVSTKKTILLGSKNNYITSGDRQITLIDVNDLIVVDTNDAILISKKGSSHKIKELILKKNRIKV